MDVSTIIPTYNSKNLLLQCLKSLENQDFPKNKYEVIVIDDGSTDGTYDSIKKQRWKVKLEILKQNRKGPAAARNLGARKAKGKILAFTDADCVVKKKWISNLVGAYKKFPEVVGIGGPLKPSKNNLVAKIEIIKNKLLHKMVNGEIIGREETPVGFTNNMSYKSEIFRKFKGFDESFSKPAGEDFDLKQRICKAGYKVAYIPNPTIHMEPYDLNYFLRQILKRGTEKKLTKMNNVQMIIEIIKNLPEILHTLTKKTAGYRKAYRK